jgi:FG-GAP repeat
MNYSPFVKAVIACAALLLALADSSLASSHTRGPNPADSDWNNQALVLKAATSAGANPTSADLLARAVTTTITEKFKIAPEGEVNSFGYSVSLSGNRALLGTATYDRATAAAYVYVFIGGVWTLEATLIPSDLQLNNTYGSAVSLSGARALVGAPYSSNSSSHGQAYVFAFDGTNWNEEAKLVSSGSDNLDFFGWAVSIQGDRALVGAWGEVGNDGAAYIFERTGTSWSESAKLLPTPDQGSGFGIAVSLSGQRALVGQTVGNEIDFSGAAYVFRVESGSWSQEAKLSVVNSPDESFAAAVSLSGNRALIGAPQGFSKGSAYVFAFDGRAWDQTAHIFALSEVTSGGNFGQSVSLSGRRALIGASEDNNSIGSAYLYRFDGAIWTEQEKLVASDGAPDDEFGFSVSLEGQRALIGAGRPQFGGTGAAYVFGGL